MTSAFARIALCSLLAIAWCAVSAPPARAAAAAKKKKKAAPKKAAKPAAKKVTADTLLKWKRAGMSDAEVAARAADAGYRLSEKDKAKLSKAKARTLIGALQANPARAVEQPPPDDGTVRPIDLSKITREEDIDFDSVPPPPGTPAEYVHKKQGSAKIASTRAAAPAAEKRTSAADRSAADRPATDRPATEKQAAEKQAGAGEAGAKHRVVYTAANE